MSRHAETTLVNLRGLREADYGVVLALRLPATTRTGPSASADRSGTGLHVSPRS